MVYTHKLCNTHTRWPQQQPPCDSRSAAGTDGQPTSATTSVSRPARRSSIVSPAGAVSPSAGTPPALCRTAAPPWVCWPMCSKCTGNMEV
ncbi:hypothetical protein Pcinc_019138 [Petrolisthes cinctipes]|uniref:Uncharacterized protein n=1 Tax=Petrolisthes cinctipes TaxID=88211 RepID=A0AAE1FM18_PETCI|nr:hypothetical protein Pcinc_019138 [Petrolisthes cinctipes]